MNKQNKKREQLANLLVNKFRNKYNVNSAKDAKIDAIIQKEVSSLLQGGHATEANLFKLDSKLETLINEARVGADDQKSQVSRSEAASVRSQISKAPDVDDIKSLASQRSKTSAATPVAVVGS